MPQQSCLIQVLLAGCIPRRKQRSQVSLLCCRCEFWVWCDHKKGCDDAGDFSSGMYPYQGCQLMQLPKDVEPQNWDRGPMFSSFQSGYITGERAAPTAA